MDEEIILGEKKYISSRRAGELFGYASDYVTQLCRGGKIDARRIGQTWFIAEDSLKEHAQTKIPRRPRSGSIKNYPPPFESKEEGTYAISASVDSWESSLLKEGEDIQDTSLTTRDKAQNAIPIKRFLPEYHSPHIKNGARTFEARLRENQGIHEKTVVQKRSSAHLFLWAIASIFFLSLISFLTIKEGTIVYNNAQNVINLDETAQQATVIDRQ